MENKKKIIIVISILIVYFIIMMIAFGFGHLKKKINYLEILMGPDTYLKYEKGVWKDVTKTDELLGKSYQIYDQYHFLYQGILQYTNNKWYAFNSSNRPLDLPDEFFAYRGNMKLNIIPFVLEDMSEDELREANEILQEQSITEEVEYTKAKKVEVDINKDQRKETIYIISNTFGLEAQSKSFSIVYIKMNGKRNILIQEVSEDMYQVPSITLSEIMDLHNDQKYELIFKKTYFDQIGTCHQILEYKNKNYHTIKECKILKRGDEKK